MVNITINQGKVHVASDYHPVFVKRARETGGKWNGDEWVFDFANITQVKRICMDVYGEDGMTGAEKVVVEVNLDEIQVELYGDLVMFGRVLVRRTGRDYPVKLHESVIVLEGGFPLRGGSSKHPKLDPYEGTILKVTDVPKKFAEGVPGVKIVDEISAIDTTIKQLKMEKEKLEKRLLEVNHALEIAKEERRKFI